MPIVPDFTGNNFVTLSEGNNKGEILSKEEFERRNKIDRLEEEDRKRYIKDVVNLTRAFQNEGISIDTAANLAGMFYNDPSIRSRRERRRKETKK